MKGTKPRRGKRNPFRPGGLPRKGRGKPRLVQRVPIAPPAPPSPQPKPKAADFGPLVAPAEEAAASASRRWPVALVLLALVVAGGVAWTFVWRDRVQPPPDAPTTLAARSDTAEIKRLLRQLDFAPGPEGDTLDPATGEAI